MQRRDLYSRIRIHEFLVAHLLSNVAEWCEQIISRDFNVNESQQVKPLPADNRQLRKVAARIVPDLVQYLIE